jgi:hypothetical protein
VTVLKFDRSLYAGPSVDEAVKVFAGFAEFTLAEETAAWIVNVTAVTPVRERMVARELSNCALGLTIRGRSRA